MGAEQGSTKKLSKRKPRPTGRGFLFESGLDQSGVTSNHGYYVLLDRKEAIFG